MRLTTYLRHAASAAGRQAKRWWWLGAGLVGPGGGLRGGDGHVSKLVVHYFMKGKNAQRVDPRITAELHQGHRLAALEPLRRLLHRFELRIVQRHDDVPRVRLRPALDQLRQDG